MTRLFINQDHATETSAWEAENQAKEAAFNNALRTALGGRDPASVSDAEFEAALQQVQPS